MSYTDKYSDSTKIANALVMDILITSVENRDSTNCSKYYVGLV